MVSRFGRAAKAWFAAVVAGVGALEVALLDDVLTQAEVVRVVGAALGALAVVYNVTNEP
jgi:hypothetical protein